jgi:hypothetical protein
LLDVQYSLFDEIKQENKVLNITPCFNKLSIDDRNDKKVRKTDGQGGYIKSI